MSMFSTVKNFGLANLYQKAGVPVEIVAEERAKSLATKAPHGPGLSYLSIQPDGSTVRTEMEHSERDISDEQALREENGDKYADSRQQKATETMEEISRLDVELREIAETAKEHRENHDELLRSTPDHHFVRRLESRNRHIFRVIQVSEIAALFFPLADMFGIDITRMGAELLKHPILSLLTNSLSVGLFYSFLDIARRALFSERRALWIAALVAMALALAKIRAMQASALQETDMDQLFTIGFFLAVGIFLPLVAASFEKNWHEAEQITGHTDSMERRLNELEARYAGRLREINQERGQWQGMLDQLTNEFRVCYEQRLKAREQSRNESEDYMRYMEAQLAQVRLFYRFWEGWRSRERIVPRPIKRFARITALLLAALVISLFGLGIVHAENGFNLLALCDRSNSAGELSCTPEALKDAGRYWIGKADEAGGGLFEIFLIDKGFDTTAIFFSSAYPLRFPGPVSSHKKKWQNEFLKELAEKTKSLPTGRGSAIGEAIFRVSLRIPSDGETLIYVLSDMREVSETFNFENRVPTESEFARWLETKAIRPKFKPGTKLLVCGIHPYSPLGTSRMTTENYEQLVRLWSSVFTKWGLKASLSEACSLKNQN